MILWLKRWLEWLVSNEEPKLGPKLFVSFLKRMFKSTKKLTSTFVFRTCARSRSVLSMEAASTASSPSVFMYATCCVADRSPNCAVESSAIILILLLGAGTTVDMYDNIKKTEQLLYFQKYSLLKLKLKLNVSLSLTHTHTTIPCD